MWRDTKDRAPVLPRWAKVINVKPRQELNGSEEEMYVRTRIYHRSAARVDSALTDVLRRQMRPVVDKLQSFFDLTDPKTNQMKDEEVEESGVTDIDDNNGMSAVRELILNSLHLPQHHDANLLPVALLQGPFSLQDRWTYMNLLVELLQKDRVAVVDLCNTFRHRCRSFVMTKETTRLTVLEEVLRQCLDKDSAPLDKPMKDTSVYDTFLIWAQTTNSFDKILICLENVDMVLGIELFQYLAFLRAQVGIQVEVVLLCGPGETSLSLSSRNGGVAGLIIHSLWHDLWIGSNPLPIILSKATSLELANACSLHDNSVVQAVARLKNVMALHFANPGTSIVALADQTIFNEVWGRMAVFYVTHELRATAAELCESSVWEETKNDLKRFAVALKLILSISKEENLSTPMLLKWTGDVSANDLSRAMEDFAAVADSWDTRKILSFLATLSSDVNTLIDKVPHESSEAKEFGNITNLTLDFVGTERREGWLKEIAQLIVLTEHSEGNEMAFHRDLRNQVHGMFRSTIMALALAEKSPLLVTGLSQRSFLPCPRRWVSSALCEAPYDRESVGVGNVASNLFVLIRDRYSVVAEEWYEALVGDDEQTDMSALFGLGLHQLILCGLLREKPSSHEALYEKAALVWCRRDF